MKTLLVVGAGGHGKVVEEVAKDCGYDKVEFLDDNCSNAIGRIDDIEKFSEKYEYAFVGIGNNKFRGTLIERLEKAGYKVSTLIHPTAYIARTAQIGKGTVVEPKAIVNVNAQIGRGGIVSIGSIIDHDAIVGDYCHVNAGVIVNASETVDAYTKLEFR